jgi:carboxylate-amine ligase
VAGVWTDPRSGARRPTAEHLAELLEAIAPAAERLGCAAEAARARDLLERPRAEAARALGPRGMSADVADRFLSDMRTP